MWGYCGEEEEGCGKGNGEPMLPSVTKQAVEALLRGDLGTKGSN